MQTQTDLNILNCNLKWWLNTSCFLNSMFCFIVILRIPFFQERINPFMCIKSHTFSTSYLCCTKYSLRNYFYTLYWHAPVFLLPERVIHSLWNSFKVPYIDMPLCVCPQGGSHQPGVGSGSRRVPAHPGQRHQPPWFQQQVHVQPANLLL